jgi:N-acetyltransferase 10
VYLRQTPNDLTGEHSSIMLRPLQDQARKWVSAFNSDFRRRCSALLGSTFRGFGCKLAQAVLKSGSGGVEQQPALTAADVDVEYGAYNLRRLESYAKNLVDHHVIADMLPTIARHHFLGRLSVSGGISAVQSTVLIGLGLQLKSMDVIAEELELPINQLLALFNKLMRKFSAHLRGLKEEAVASKAFPAQASPSMVGKSFKSLDVEGQGASNLGNDLSVAAQESVSKLAKKQAAFLGKDLTEYALKGDDNDWEAALKGGKVKGNVSIKAKGGSKKKRKRIHDGNRG